EQLFDLAGLAATGHPRTGPRDADLNIPELGFKVVRPAIAVRLERPKRRTSGTLPAIAGKPAQGACDRAFKRGGGVVPRAVWLSAYLAPLFDILVRTRIPALARHIDPAAERDAIVDHHNLL